MEDLLSVLSTWVDQRHLRQLHLRQMTWELTWEVLQGSITVIKQLFLWPLIFLSLSYLTLTIDFQFCWYWSLSCIITDSASILTSMSMTNWIDHQNWSPATNLRSAQTRLWMNNVSLKAPCEGERRVAIHHRAHKLTKRAFVNNVFAKRHWNQNWGF